jgi:phospholipid/cholesterol/gamma-HCH transport system substrate-binding protein
MNGQATHEGLRVGFVLFVALIILLTGLYVVALSPTVVGGMVTFRTYFSETGGLLTGAPVWIGGVEVGSVKDVGFTSEARLEEGRREIEVVIAVARRFANQVRENSVCRVRTRGLLGERIITVQTGTGDAPPAPPDGILPSEEGIDIEKTLAVAERGMESTVDAVVRTLDELRRILVDIREQRGTLGKLISSDEFYRETIGQLRQVVTDVTRELRALNTTVRDEIVRFREDASKAVATIEDEIRVTGRDVRDTTAAFRGELEEVGALVRDVREGPGTAGLVVRDPQLADRIRTIVARLEESLAAIASTLARVERGEGTVGKLVQDPSAYDSIRDLFEGVQQSWLLRSAVRDAEATGRALRIERTAAEDQGSTAPEPAEEAKER